MYEWLRLSAQKAYCSQRHQATEYLGTITSVITIIYHCLFILENSIKKYSINGINPKCYNKSKCNLFLLVQLTENLVPKICDFGMARVKIHLSSSTTTTSGFAGTAYVSPIPMHMYSFKVLLFFKNLFYSYNQGIRQDNSAI